MWACFCTVRRALPNVLEGHTNCDSRHGIKRLEHESLVWHLILQVVPLVLRVVQDIVCLSHRVGKNVVGSDQIS